MTNGSLAQAEADALLALRKRKVDEREWIYPTLGGSLTIPLKSQDRTESFLLDIYRSNIKLQKGSYQNRGRGIIILARLCFNGPPHRNPDGNEVASPHLHLYREGHGDKWAIPAPVNFFPNASDPGQSLTDFMDYCRIVDPPSIKKDLFT